MTAATDSPSRVKLALAFACVYVIWGSTYLGIRFAIETMPPLLMAGIRFLIAGALLYLWVALRGEARRPTREQWTAAAVLGILFFLGGNGGVSWAEQRVPSGLAALLVATIPFWLVMMEWLSGSGMRPSVRVMAGIAAGFAGVALLVGSPGAGAAVDRVGAAVLIVAPMCWALGTVISRRLSHPASHLQSGAMQMLAGGAALVLVGLAMGEGARFRPDAVSSRSLLALLYLIFFGSIVAFSAYNWLLHATTPARVGTYAFVNPAVAVLLGWAFAGEAVGPMTLIAGAFILTGVILIVGQRSKSAAAKPKPAPSVPLTTSPQPPVSS